MEKKPRCTDGCPTHTTMFCPECGHADIADLRKIRLMGPIGVLHSNSPKIEQFWQTGDPSVFSQK